MPARVAVRELLEVVKALSMIGQTFAEHATADAVRDAIARAEAAL